MNIKSPDQIDVEVGQRIRIQRKTLGVSQTTLADQLGITFQQVQKYENGRNRVSAGRLTKIADVLRVPVMTLLGSEDGPIGKHKDHGGVSSPLKLLTGTGALQLLRAYGKITDSKMRRSVLEIVEEIAANRDKPQRSKAT